jgi:hypothetical protein
MGFFTDLAIGTDDVKHIAWMDPYGSSGSISQTSYSAFGSIEPEWALIGPLDVSIDIRPDGTPCVAIVGYSDTSIWYSCREDAPYWMSSVEEVVGEGYNQFVALDHLNDGTPYIASFEVVSGSLQVSTLRDDEWVTERVDTIDTTGWDPQIQVDDLDRVHIGYYSMSDGSLKYAVGR